MNDVSPQPPVRRVAVLGAGTMGGGIAALLAEAGFAVVLTDPAPEAGERALARIAKRAPGANVTFVATPEEAAVAADLAIEAAPERLDVKLDLFRRLDGAAPPHAVLASNTSQLSITALAAATSRPAQVCGMHWFNPPERMHLVENVRGLASSDATMATVRAVAEACGKTVVEVADRQGFVSTRILAANLIEAMRMYEEGVASASDIDAAVKLGLNHPMGPLELADYVGLDVMLAIAESLTDALGERFRPPQGLRKRVDAGYLGRKTGRGYHEYPPRDA
ncbi:MAG: 3-hydroxyacyl-CoA dehydrogenase family protein [Trueperaceae bacterium]|nr:3-hydroxyacyl-CoA dehydrogenase family protein [Trueperaceae bacterium]